MTCIGMHLRTDKPVILRISEIARENPHVKTFWFDFELSSKPGQFIMLWIPGVDQKPFSISYDTKNRFGVSVFAVGPMSSKLFEMRSGDRVGITGPYGTAFSTHADRHYIAIGGGYGSGPLGFLAEALQGSGATVDFCVGARTADLLLFEERVLRLPHATVHISTNDGSKGFKGFITDVVEHLLKERDDKEHTILSACGPELMERAVLDLANTYGVDCELSIERYMKCGFGVCGQCCVDPLGIATCAEGPVVNKKTANRLTEFGNYHRDKSGAKLFF